MPATYYVKHTICLRDFGDFEVEADFSGDSDSLWFEGCRINDLPLNETALTQLVGRAEFARIMDDARAWWLRDGLNEAARDWADDVADHKMRLRMEDAA